MMTQDFPKEFNGLTEPYDIFKLWWGEAHTLNLAFANAFTLSTCTRDGQPTARIVLAKEIRHGEGLVFFTNYDSEKGQHIQDNPQVAASFYWDPQFRQVKILGRAERVPRADSEAYWNTRPKDRQLSQWVSRQSQPVPNRSIMEKALAEAELQFKDASPTCPTNWGGYLIRPVSIEFWVGHDNRFHDRIRFTKSQPKDGALWRAQRLYP